jgi:hypothetical protein
MKLLLCALALFLCGCATEPPTADTARKLLGTWILTEAVIPGNPSGIGIRLKIFTPGHWLITQSDPKTGIVVFHHGGTYFVSGDKLVQTTEFANDSTADHIHDVHTFTIEFHGDTFREIGLDNPFIETWRRVD